MKRMIEYINKIYYVSSDMKLYIECSKTILILPVVDGTVKINIIDLDNNSIGINNININDSIKILYIGSDTIIEPIKIIKLNNYDFNIDTSDSEEFLK